MTKYRYPKIFKSLIDPGSILSNPDKLFRTLLFEMLSVPPIVDQGNLYPHKAYQGIIIINNKIFPYASQILRTRKVV